MLLTADSRKRKHLPGGRVCTASRRHRRVWIPTLSTSSGILSRTFFATLSADSLIGAFSDAVQ